MPDPAYAVAPSAGKAIRPVVQSLRVGEMPRVHFFDCGFRQQMLAIAVSPFAQMRQHERHHIGGGGNEITGRARGHTVECNAAVPPFISPTQVRHRDVRGQRIGNAETGGRHAKRCENMFPHIGIEFLAADIFDNMSSQSIAVV